MSQKTDKQNKKEEHQEEVIATLINPIHVFSGAVQIKDYITAQKQLLRDFGEDIYFNWQLEILHAEIASIIEELKIESAGNNLYEMSASKRRRITWLRRKSLTTLLHGFDYCIRHAEKREKQVSRFSFLYHN